MVEHPQVTVQIDKQGRSNLPTLKPKQQDSNSVSIGELSLRNASLTYTDALRSLSISLPQWSGKIKDLEPGVYRIELAAGSGGVFGYQGRTVAIDKVEADFDYARSALTIRSARLQAREPYGP